MTLQSFHNQEEKVFKIREKFNWLTEKIKHIPFLDLPIQFDFESVQKEAAKILKWAPNFIEPTYWDPESIQNHANKNQGRALIEYVPDSFFMHDTDHRLLKSMRSTNSYYNQFRSKEQYHSDGRIQFFKTELATELPQTTQLLYKISDYPMRCRIMKIQANCHVGWHTHHTDHLTNDFYDFAVAQLPLDCEETCLYSVRSNNSAYPQVYSRPARKGDLFVFNSYHQHNVVNTSNHDRIALFANYSFDYEPFLEFLAPYVRDYDGPLINC